MRQALSIFLLMAILALTTLVCLTTAAPADDHYRDVADDGGLCPVWTEHTSIVYVPGDRLHVSNTTPYLVMITLKDTFEGGVDSISVPGSGVGSIDMPSGTAKACVDKPAGGCGEDCFFAHEQPISSESSVWGSIKALYR
jgi:hypothetical protein